MKFYIGKIFIIFIIAALVIPAARSTAQFNDNADNTNAIYFDAVCFKSGIDTLGRVDAYILVPYQALNFIKTGDVYGAQYQLVINVIDSLGKKTAAKNITKNVTARDYAASQGANGEFDYSQTIFELPAGKYSITAKATDSYLKKTYEKSRTITVINFSKYNFAISGIMLVSSIEETDGRHVITPHVSEDVGTLPDGFFAFFEAYNKEGSDSTDFAYQIQNLQGTVLYSSPRFRQFTGKPVTQHYLRVKMPDKNKNGTFTLRVFGLKPSSNPTYNEPDFIALAERSIKSTTPMSAYIKQDLATAIKQLRYVANQSDIDYIEAGATMSEKQERFEEFWKKMDPTPNTERNEAFEEYYARIDFANKNYRSYNEGWRTDRGMVFIIFGEPFNKERTSPYGDQRVFERWTYRDSRQFIFVDNTGFGDFRLYSPMTVSDKYRYGRY